MSDRNPLVCVDGIHREMSSGDTIPPKLNRGEIGDFKYSFSATARNGWFPCVGGTMSEACWATLVAAGLSAAWMSAFGEKTLPDFAGRVLAQPTTGHELGSTSGAETITLTESQLPSHAHSLADGTALIAVRSEAPGTTTVANPKGNVIAKGVDNSNNALKNFSNAGATEGSYLNSASLRGATSPTGSGSDVPVMQPTVYAGYWHVYLGS